MEKTKKRLQISDLHFDKFPTPATFACWKIRFKNPVTTCSDFPAEAMLWIKEVEMVDSVDELKSSRSIAGKKFPNFDDAGREDCFCSEQDHPEFPFQEKSQSGGTKKPRKRTGFYEEDRSLTCSTNTSRSLVPMILSRIMQTYLQLLFQMTMFRE